MQSVYYSHLIYVWMVSANRMLFPENRRFRWRKALAVFIFAVLLIDFSIESVFYFQDPAHKDHVFLNKVIWSTEILMKAGLTAAALILLLSVVQVKLAWTALVRRNKTTALTSLYFMFLTFMCILLLYQSFL